MVSDQNKLTCLTLHLHTGAPLRAVREVALPDKVTFPLLLDQPSQGGGEQKDTGWCSSGVGLPQSVMLV